MDQETKDTISKIQQAIWKLKDTYSLLNGIDGMEEYLNTISNTIKYLDMEIEEIWLLERDRIWQ